MIIKKKFKLPYDYEFNTDTNMGRVIGTDYMNIDDFLEKCSEYSSGIFKYRKLFLEFVLNELLDKPEFVDSSIKIQNVLLKYL